MSTTNFLRTATLCGAFAALAAGGRLNAAARPEVRLVRVGPLVYHVVILTSIASLGGEVGILYDDDLVSIDYGGIVRGPDFPDVAEGLSELRADLNPWNGCPVNKELRGGLTVGWWFSTEGNEELPAGEHAVLELRFTALPGAEGAVPRFEFVRCLGEVDAPVRTIITDTNGESVLLWPTDIPPSTLFVRGDVNDDGRKDISDAIYILDYLFVGRFERPGCLDAVDVNDSGSTEITDAVYLLRYLFARGAPPPYPFPLCGADLTGESTGDPLDCEEYLSCR